MLSDLYLFIADPEKSSRLSFTIRSSIFGTFKEETQILKSEKSELMTQNETEILVMVKKGDSIDDLRTIGPKHENSLFQLFFNCLKQS